MASSREDETDATEDSIGRSVVEGKDEDNERPADKVCSACGKESATVKKCTACKSVWYCDVACQKRQRRVHRKECNRIKKELEIAAEQLNESAERKVGSEHNEDANENGTQTKLLCSACDKESDAV